MILILLFLLQIKHLIVDWIWQPPYEAFNKHIYGHWGGVRHALKNSIGTALCFGIVSPWLGISLPVVFLVFVLDFLVHYHIDWAKMNLNTYWGLRTDVPKFWWLLGADQTAHQLTYLALVWIAT